MHILQVNCVYKKGSTGKIVADIHQDLQARGIRSTVCYGRGARCADEGVYKTGPEWYAHLNHLLTLANGIMYGGCRLSTERLIRIIKRERPDVVHLHCINGYFVNIYRLVAWLRDAGIPTVVTLHAEFMYTGGCSYTYECEQWRSPEGCGHLPCHRFREFTGGALPADRSAVMWRRMKAAFDGFNKGLLVTSVSPWLMERAQMSAILGDKPHRTVLNGLDTSVFHAYDTAALRQELGPADKPVLFHATPYFNLDPDNIKGSRYVLELAQRMPQVTFVVAGPHPADLTVPDNVMLLGQVTDQRLLAQYYSMADATLLTSRRETYSMVTAESLACGTPVVGFEAGAPERIALAEYSRFVPYGDMDALQAAVTDLLATPKDGAIAAVAAATYDRQRMVEGYLTAYETLLNEV